MADKSFMSDAITYAKTPIESTKFLATKAFNAATGQSTAGAGRGSGENDPRIVNQVGGGRGLTPASAYFHDDANVVPSASETIIFDFQPNILDNFNVYTYHWKLFITSTESAKTGAVLDQSAQTIIAESGVSDLTIDKVQINSIACPSAESGTGTSVQFKFEIVEPAGAGLIDKMFYQAQALGVGNWIVMPCYLQLEFRGRDPVSGEANGGPLAGLKWVWPIRLTSAKINVTNVGTRYEFDGINYDEIAQTNACFSIQSNLILQNLSTFGSAMDALEDKLNADQYEKLIDNYSIPDTYRIIVDQDLVGLPLIRPTDTEDTKRGGDFLDLGKKTATFNANTGMDKIIDSLLGTTDEFQEKVQGSDTPSSEPNPPNKEKDQMKKLWRIVTETKPIAFDSQRQDNALAITVFIVKYEIGVLDATAAQTGQTAETEGAARIRMHELVKKKILQKRYNYIFTGLNDQIISLDLSMNYSFAAAISRFGGIYYDSALKDKSIVNQKQQEENKTATENVRKTLQFINSGKPGINVDAEVAKSVAALKTATNLDPILRERYTILLENAKKPQRIALTTAAQKSGGIAANGSTQALKQAATNANGLVQPINGYKFVSDVNVNPATVEQAKAIAQSVGKGKLRPVPFREAPQENNFVGTDAASNAGRARTSSLFATALYSTLDASLQSIKINVKGDPFWLFPRSIGLETTVLPSRLNMQTEDGKFDVAAAIYDIKHAHKKTDSVNILGTDNFIVLRFRTPKIYNQVTGSVDPFDEVETFSGVYKVTRIISKFEMGKFSQELECILDPVLDLSKFLKEMALQNIRLDTELFPATALPTKTQRLMGDITVPGQVATLRDLKGDVQNIISGNNPSAALASNIPPDKGFTALQQIARNNPSAG